MIHRLLGKGIILGVPGCHWRTISHKGFLHTCARPLRVDTRTCVLTALRCRASNAARFPSVTVRSATTHKTRVFKKLIVLASPHKWRLFGAIAFLLVSSAVTMAAPFCFGKVIDIINSAEKERVKENLTKVTLLLLGAYVLGALCNFSRIYLITTTGYRITQTLRKQAYGAILRQEVAFFDRHSTGELAGRIAGDTEQISSAVTNNVSDGLRSTISAVVGISMMVYLSPKFALVSLSCLPVLSALMFGIGRQFKKISSEIQNQMAELNKRAQEKISNIRTVKAFGKEQWEEQRYEAGLQELLVICYKECLRKGVFFGLAGLSGSSVILSVLYYGGLMVSQSTLTIGELSAFLAYAAYVALSLRGLATYSTDLNKALGANERLVALIEREPLIPCMGGLTLDKPLLGDIHFQNVNFAYPSRESVYVLRDFNLRIPKRTVTAIVGQSGSGKSTLAALLLRFYEPGTGRVLLDDYDLKTLDPLWVKSQIAIVPQEPVLFSGTIKENILYGVDDATEDDVKRVAERSYVSQFAASMPQGLDTYVGERGVTLSGGQRQRVAIARALIKEPRILILDEATSALDAESESYVQKALEEATVGRTVLIIAHRLSTIKNANKIVLLDRGRITETGTYSELMSIANGSFKKLVQHQTSAGQFRPMTRVQS